MIFGRSTRRRRVAPSLAALRGGAAGGSDDLRHGADGRNCTAGDRTARLSWVMGVAQNGWFIWSIILFVVGTPSSHPFVDGIFHYKPFMCFFWGTPMTMENPIGEIWVFLEMAISLGLPWHFSHFKRKPRHGQNPSKTIGFPRNCDDTSNFMSIWKVFGGCTD